MNVHNRRGAFRKPVLAIVLAGGRGSRLGELTKRRCKPELPFAKNRLIDFALANIINSQVINHTMVLTQYEQQGLIAHLDAFNLNSSVWDKSVSVYPAQQRHGDDNWYGGTANAVFQNADFIAGDDADTVVILAADHIYKLDIRQMITFHQDQKSDFTVCGYSMPTREAAGNFGVMELDEEDRIVGFAEKPKVPKTIPGRGDICFASMGIYMIKKSFLLKVLETDHADTDSKHDFGQNIIPRIIAEKGAIFGYDYLDNIIPGEVQIVDGKEVPVQYWRDVGRIGPYWEALMDLVAVVPQLNLYNPAWPVPTAWDRLPPAKFITPDQSRYFAEFSSCNSAEWYSADYITAGGCIFDSPRRLFRSVIGRSVRTQYGVVVEYSVVFDGAVLSNHASLTHTIVEEGVVVPAGVRVGYDLDEDIRNGVFIDEQHDPQALHPPIRVVTRDTHWGNV